MTTIAKKTETVSESSSGLETALEKIGNVVASKYVQKDCILGLGSGSTVAKFAKVLGSRVQKESLNVRVVPSSMQAWLLAKQNNLPFYGDTSHCPVSVDVAVDGADQIATTSRAMVKGGGGALFKEKIILSSAKRSFILGDSTKFVEKLKRSVPVEVLQFALATVENRIKTELHCEPILRKLDKGYPFFTESGNVILDCQFSEEISDPIKGEKSLKMISGVIEVGIFNCKVDKFFKGNPDGTFESF